MKPIKLFALILAVCLLSCAFVACDSGDSGTDANSESATQAAEKVTIKNVTLIIQENGKDKATLNYDYTGEGNTLENVIKFFCIAEYGSADGCFASTGLLAKIGEIEGETWEAYDKDKGTTAGKIDSMKTYEVSEGAKIVLNCKK